MEAFISNNVGDVKNSERKARQLVRALFDEDRLGLEYDSTLTQTAEQTFNTAVGNCLSFSYLFAALAKRAGLDVQFQEVHMLPQWDFTSDEIYVENRHVNVRVKIYGDEDIIVDIDQVLPDFRLDYTLLEENHVLALYYGNVAAEFLMNNDFEQSYKFFIKALRTDKSIAALWTNLGVLYKRTGNFDFAEKAYFMALSINEKEKAALNNLAHMYSELGDEQRADLYGDLVNKYQARNPYFRYVRARKAMEDNRLDQAMGHIKYAIRKKEDEPRFYILKGAIHQIKGEANKARKALRTAETLQTEAG
jgi:tetratricopeptide (TPR) repeat protein